MIRWIVQQNLSSESGDFAQIAKVEWCLYQVLNLMEVKRITIFQRINVRK